MLLVVTSNECIILEISIVNCIVHVTLLSANVQALSYTQLSCGKMIIFCPPAVSPTLAAKNIRVNCVSNLEKYYG